METIQKNPTPNSFWVIPERLLVGEHPGTTGLKARQNVQQLLGAGVTVFIDLTRTGEGYDYENMLAQEAGKLHKLIAYYQMTIRDESVPKPHEMSDILNLIDTAISVNRKVYVHCLHGRGRVGTVVGCYLVRHGMSGSQALQEVARLRESLTTGAKETSPRTSQQQQMVLGWKEGQ